MAEVVRGVEEMHGDRMSQRVHGSAGNPGRLRVAGEDVLDLSFLERPLTAGEEVRPGLTARAELLRGVAPELLAAEAVLKPADPDAVILEIEVLGRSIVASSTRSP